MGTNHFAIVRVSTFVRQHVASNAALLDIGAGRGIVAADLARYGFKVTAIDSSDKSIQLAKANGVTVTKASIGSFSSSSTFDAALLSMVAHHINPLDQALDQTRSLLKAGGRVLLEDFAVEDADEPTASWFYQTLANMKAAGLLDETKMDLLAALDEPVKMWWQDHSDEHHPFNTGAKMLELVRQRFEVLHVERCPYFYRYVASACGERAPATNFGASIFEVEDRLIRAGKIKALGLRIVAAKS